MNQFAKKIKLTNGLAVIYEKNNNANIVSLNMGIHVGSVYETNDESGISHLIEHMVFKGTKSYQAGEIATLIESHGGELNAFTSLDQTVYYINLPSQHFHLGLKLLKEMVFDATFDATELKREKEVVIEEIRRGEDSPARVLGETLFEACYKKHNYRRPVIGTAKLVSGFTRDKIVSFYNRYYTPRNMVLGVCGNISESQLSQELEQLFRFQVGPLSKSSAFAAEPLQKKHQVISKTMDINATYFDLAFQAPDLTHRDVPALDVLSHLLGESSASLLRLNTKEKEQLVHSIGSSCYTPKFPGLFIISGLVDPKLINKALFSIKDQIEYMKTHPVENEKIERTKLLARSQLIFEKQTCEGTAKKWMIYETTVGDYKYDEKYIEQISRLTALDVQKAANKYLDFNRSTLVILHPKKIKITIDKSLYKQSAHKKRPSIKKDRFYRGTSVHRLDNGIHVVLKENHRLPLVSVKTSSLGGLRNETASNNGINQLISNIITKSTKNLSQVALSEKNEWLAAQLASYTGRNSIGISYNFLSERCQDALEILTDVILNPSFDPQEIQKEKAQQLEAIKNRSDNSGQVCFHMVMQRLFNSHPYKYHLLGEKEPVTKLNANQLEKYYKNTIVPKNLVMAVVGDFNTDRILDTLNKNFSTLPQKGFSNKKLKAPQSPSKIITLSKKQDKQQAHIAIGFLGASFYDKDRFALEVINNILSGQGGRLFLELRDKLSLAYSVSSTMIQGMETGFFGAYIATEPAKVKTAIDAMIKELKKISTTPISAEELQRAKNYIIGNHEIDHQKNGAIAMQLALNELYGKGLEEFFDFQKDISSVTREDILKTAQKYITLNRCILGVVGPEKFGGPR
ncbi:MAG: insulinase family protein [Deltaproteobacteria bacterium]|nr:insulinase family protein [Deltaproteobacteria bacterium]